MYNNLKETISMSPYDAGWVHAHRVTATGTRRVTQALERARKDRNKWYVRYIWYARRQYLDGFIRRLEKELE